MRNLANTKTILFPNKAEELAAELNSDTDDDWTYKVVRGVYDPGAAWVACYDEKGRFVNFF